MPSGHAPRWITARVVAVWVGIPVVVVLYVGALGIAWSQGVDQSFGSSPRPVVTVVVVAVLLDLVRARRARAPLDREAGNYHRLALLVVGAFGLMTSWAIGAVVGALLLAHSLLVDRSREATR